MNQPDPATDGADTATRLARVVRWPASPVRRIRLVCLAITQAMIVVLTLSGIAAAGSDPVYLVTTGCVLGVSVLLVDQYRRGRVSPIALLTLWVLLAGACLTDGPTQIGSGIAQATAFILGLYASARRCVAHCLVAQALLTTSVIVKEQVGIDARIGVAESFFGSVGCVLLAAIAFTVISIVGRYERMVERDTVILQAGTALVAAHTREHVYSSVQRAATELIDASSDRAVVAVLPESALPESVRAELDRLGAGVDPLRHRVDASSDGFLMPLGREGDRPVVLLSTGEPRLSRYLVTGLRALEPTVELALRTAELTEGLRRQAFQDALTGLANRACFADRLERALHGGTALLLLDLDGFKTINDTLGHAAGDELLVTTAQRLRTCVGPEDLVARLGGDEFVVLIENADGPDRPVAVAERVLAALADPCPVAGTAVQVRASVGIAIATAATATADRLLADADRAMYAAKAQGKGCYRLHEAAVVSQRA